MGRHKKVLGTEPQVYAPIELYSNIPDAYDMRVLSKDAGHYKALVLSNLQYTYDDICRVLTKMIYSAAYDGETVIKVEFIPYKPYSEEAMLAYTLLDVIKDLRKLHYKANYEEKKVGRKTQLTLYISWEGMVPMSRLSETDQVKKRQQWKDQRTREKRRKNAEKARKAALKKRKKEAEEANEKNNNNEDIDNNITDDTNDKN